MKTLTLAFLASAALWGQSEVCLTDPCQDGIYQFSCMTPDGSCSSSPPGTPIPETEDPMFTRECTSLLDVDCRTESGDWQTQHSDGCNVCTQKRYSNIQTCTLMSCLSPYDITAPIRDSGVISPSMDGTSPKYADLTEPNSIGTSIAITNDTITSPTIDACQDSEIRYRVEWAQQVPDTALGPLWRRLEAVFWEQKRAVRLARRMIAVGEQDFRSIRVWEMKDVRLDCEVDTK